MQFSIFTPHSDFDPQNLSGGGGADSNRKCLPRLVECAGRFGRI